MPRIKSVTLNLRIEPALKEAAERAAAAERRSLTTLVEVAIAEYLRKHGHSPPPAKPR
jgi:predicted HicB family RNase H-like nuclease